MIPLSSNTFVWHTDFESTASETDGSDNPLSYFGLDDNELEPVEIYTPPITLESDLARDERETTKEDIEPKQLFAEPAANNECLNSDIQEQLGDCQSLRVNGKETRTLMLLDSGSTRHMVGRLGLPYANNIRQNAGTNVETIGGNTVMDLVCDVQLRDGTILADCLINDTTDLNIASEGRLRTGVHQWRFDCPQDLKRITKPNGDTYDCFTNGIPDFLPQKLEMVPWPSQHSLASE